MLPDQFGTEATFMELVSGLIHSYLPFSHIMTPGVKEHELPSQLVGGTAIKATSGSTERQLCLTGDTHIHTQSKTSMSVHTHSLKPDLHVHMNADPRII